VVCVDSEVSLEAEALEKALTVGMAKACRVMSGSGTSFLVRVGGDSPPGGGRRQESGA
jgi:hypothetical protein